ncbi:ABC transporter permease [Parabacteroides sp. FAFU027]|uniref:ABC transporter permease n=1 Tax=Parabacteroides sp. FAFU027 TaxID=2922715 RepID=UPI001FAF292F|nr:ABC transporter permease [Parabacteroides sp. FAFU027]
MDISYTRLLLGYLLLLIPVYYLQYYKTGLVKDTLLAAVRMSIQLFLIGIYLEFLFKLNNPWVNMLWVIVMILTAGYTVVKRSKQRIGLLWMPVSVAILISVVICAGFFLGIVLNLPSAFEARYFIPICGMVLGNILNTNVISLNTFYSGIERERTLYLFSLANGAHPAEAQRYFMREALIKSLNPAIATMAVMGLISLPGIMTGQILGGSSPSVAIKYQIMIMIVIFSSSLISVLVTLWLSTKRAFDKFGIPLK